VDEEVALNAGLECARKAARKFAKNGRFVGMMRCEQMIPRWRTGDGGVSFRLRRTRDRKVPPATGLRVKL
jgi:hypothetical protein